MSDLYSAAEKALLNKYVEDNKDVWTAETDWKIAYIGRGSAPKTKHIKLTRLFGESEIMSVNADYVSYDVILNARIYKSNVDVDDLDLIADKMLGDFRFARLYPSDPTQFFELRFDDLGVISAEGRVGANSYLDLSIPYMRIEQRVRDWSTYGS